MTFLVDRLGELREHLDHLAMIRPRVRSVDDLERDRSMQNDVMFSLLMICQLVIDVAGELSSRRRQRYADYREAVKNLRLDQRFPEEVVVALERLPGFRNVVMHAYIALNHDMVMAALNDLEPVERFLETVRTVELAD